jgi:hypothetical protein
VGKKKRRKITIDYLGDSPVVYRGTHSVMIETEKAKISVNMCSNGSLQITTHGMPLSFPMPQNVWVSEDKS